MNPDAAEVIEEMAKSGYESLTKRHDWDTQSGAIRAEALLIASRMYEMIEKDRDQWIQIVADIRDWVTRQGVSP